MITRAQTAAAVHIDESVSTGRPGRASSAWRPGYLLDANNGLNERIAIPSHNIVFNRDMVELLLETRVETTFSVGRISHSRVECCGSARPG